MNLKTSILADLIEKYEKSKHLKEPHTSNRRVTLSKEKGELKGYHWENLSSLEEFAQEVQFLQEKNLVFVEWEVENKVISLVVLNLEQVEDSYTLLDCTPPWVLREEGLARLQEELRGISSPWIREWIDFHIQQLEKTWKLPPFLNKGEDFATGLFSLFRRYDVFPECGMTLRSFSVEVFQNSKTLEKIYKDDFLKICREFHPELSEIYKEEGLSEKEQLFFLGITPRGEFFELSGKINIVTQSGILDVGSVGQWGLALSGFSCDLIQSMDLSSIKEVFFIENKTNYEQMIQSQRENALFLYHGGFFSPSKGRFFQILSKHLTAEMKVYFWGDIDLGGFMMFGRLQNIIPRLKPYQMGVEEMEKYKDSGLQREESYLKKVKIALEEEKFPLFQGVLEKILEYQLTIEQEVFLG